MANIKINQTPTRVQFTATAGQTVFSYTFPIKADSDLAVYSRIAGSTADDATDILVLTTNYTVTGANTAAGGTVVLVVGATVGDIVTIVGDKPVDRDSIYDQGVTLSRTDLNNDFNDNVMYDKQIETIQNQLSPKYNRSEEISNTVREDNLVLPILDDNEIWIGRGNQGDATDDITKVALGTQSVLLDVDYVIGTAEALLPNAQVMTALANGLMINTAGVLSTQVLTGTAAEITILNGAGGGVPTVGLADNLVLPGTEGFVFVTGTTAQRPGAPVAGESRWNTTTSEWEGWDGAAWVDFVNTGGASIAATYLTLADESASLANSFSLGSLSTGLLLNTVAAAISTVTQAVQGTDYYAPGGTDVAVVDGGTGSSTAGGARTNLGLVIGTDVQAFDATLLSIAALGTAADKMLYTTALDTWAEADITAAGRAILDDANAAAQRTTLGLVIGTDVQAFDATLLSIAALGTAADRMAYTTGVDTWAEATLTAAGRAILDDANAAAQRTTLGLVIGTDVQAFDATLLSIAALGTAADKMLYTTALDTWAEADITAAGRAILDDANAAAQRTTLGLVIGTDVQAFDATLAAWAAFNTNGILTQTAADTFTGRTITGTAAEITVTNGDGVAANPTISLPTALTFTGKTVTGGTFTGITDIVVADGGSGRSTSTAFAVICGGTTTTAAHQSIASLGSSGQILTSNGAGALPTMQAAAGGGGEGAKVWLNMSGDGLTINDSFNVTSVADTAAGRITITIGTDFANADYVCPSSVASNGSGSAIIVAAVKDGTIAVGSVEIDSFGTGGTPADPAEGYHISMFGDQ